MATQEIQEASNNSNLAPMAPVGGNTIPRPVASKRWVFTYFYENGDMAPIFKVLENHGDGVFGKEKCPSTEREHLQGYIELYKKGRPLELFKDSMPGAHWEKAKGSRQDNILYCTKEGNWMVFGKKKDTYIPPEAVIDPLEGLEYYDWQKEILEILTKPNQRKLHWFWEEEGGAGKSMFCKHLILTKPNIAYLTAGKGRDFKYAIAETLNHRTIKTILFDIPRTLEEGLSYSAIEELLNGMIFSPKFESKTVVFNIPHIICFANFPPDNKKLSADRWYIKNIDKI